MQPFASPRQTSTASADFAIRGTVRTGFTLIELLVVITFIGLLSTMSMVAFGSLSRSSGLVAGGNRIATLANLARQNSMAKNVATALVVLADQGMDEDYRAAMLLEFNPDDPARQWKQLTKWEILPTGVVANINSTFFSNVGTPLPYSASGELPAKIRGSAVSQFASRIFLANGSIATPSDPALIELVEGAVNNGTLQTRWNQQGEPVNYYRISIVGNTGRIKINQL